MTEPIKESTEKEEPFCKPCYLKYCCARVQCIIFQRMREEVNYNYGIEPEPIKEKPEEPEG